MRPWKGVVRRDHTRHTTEMKQQEDWNPSVSKTPNEGWLAWAAAKNQSFLSLTYHPTLPQANIYSSEFNICVATILLGDSASKCPLFIPSPHQNLERAKRKGLWEKLSRGCLPAWSWI